MAITKLIGTDPNQVPVNGMLGTLAFQEDVNFDALTNKTSGTGDYTTTGTFTGNTLASTVATGTAPLTVASTTLVTNLNADQLDGVEGSGYLTTTGTQTFTNKTIGDLTETVYTITDGASVDLNPANGPIQVWTLGANRTPTATNFAAGESMMLMIDDGTAYTITWPTMTWVGGSAPTLATSGYTVVEMWKVGSTLYGATVGDVA